MKKFIIYAYRVLSVIAVFYGLLLFIVSIVKDEPNYAVPGISLFFSGFSFWGFSYIVEAACTYIMKNNNTARQSPVHNKAII